MPLSLFDLVANRTLSPQMAATLAAAAQERCSLLFVALPRMAGKSTVMQAALQYAPEGTPFHHLSRAAGPTLGIPKRGDGGYLVVSEISPAGFEEYLWDDDARQVFAALDRGFSLVTALHAGSPDEAFEVLTRENGIPEVQAARIDIVVYIRSIGPWSRPSRRVVAAIAETDGVHPRQARLLHRWIEAGDRFEAVEPSQRVSPETVAQYLGEFGAG
ncbi:MAG: hypothetical protein EPO65_07895 [Dehalococcoidia bacterium]|nr:MAG: hypothetical protein EPO65_07895 [Dehalococcoidia bacterium]